jgi:creatinine amidohydrolase
MNRITAALGIAGLLGAAVAGQQTGKPATSSLLSDSFPKDVEGALTASTVVLIPLGAAAVDRGRHLKLGADERLARYITTRVQSATPVVVAPSFNYHFSPVSPERAGSTSLTEPTARDVTIDVVRTLAWRSGPRRFYILNTGVQTMGPLSKAAAELSRNGILLGYTDPQFRSGAANARAYTEEAYTSMMLFVDPASVDMTAAGSPSALATREKGQGYLERLVSGVLEDIETIRTATLPAATNAPSRAPGSAAGRTGPPSEQRMPNGCTPDDERTIRQIGPLFGSAWKEMDPDKISLMFTGRGDIRHPDGLIERGRDIIRINRRELFMKPDYRGSVHLVSLNDIRCLGTTYAIADGKWELRLENKDKDTFNGWCTLVLDKSSGSWLVEAWRYTVDPPRGTPPPTILKQPGFIGRGH